MVRSRSPGIRFKQGKLRPTNQLPEVAIKTDQVLTEWIVAAASHASGTAFPLRCFSMQSCRGTGHSGPSDARWTPGAATSASTKARASSTGVGSWKIFGLLTSRRKLASTIGIRSSVLPEAAAEAASSSQLRAIRWCGWSLREAATRTLTSGVLAHCCQHCLVAQRIDASRQSAASFKYGKTQLASLGRRPFLPTNSRFTSL